MGGRGNGVGACAVSGGGGQRLRLGDVARANDDLVARFGEQTGQALGHVAGAENCDGHVECSLWAIAIDRLVVSNMLASKSVYNPQFRIDFRSNSA